VQQSAVDSLGALLVHATGRRARGLGVDANERVGPRLVAIDRDQTRFNQVDGAHRARSQLRRRFTNRHTG
jgi:hypothetical protein